MKLQICTRGHNCSKWLENCCWICPVYPWGLSSFWCPYAGDKVRWTSKRMANTFPMTAMVNSGEGIDFFFFFHYKKKRKNVGNVDTNISLMELDMLDWILVVQTHLEIVWTDWWWLTHDRVSNVTEWPIMWTTGENSWRSSAPLQWMSLIVLIITKFFNIEVFNIQYIL